MEDIKNVSDIYLNFLSKLEDKKQEYERQLSAILNVDELHNQPLQESQRQLNVTLNVDESENQPLQDVTNMTSLPRKKQTKCLTALHESEETNIISTVSRAKNSVSLEVIVDEEQQRGSPKRSSKRLPKQDKVKVKEEANVSKAFEIIDTVSKLESDLMPPPLAPAAVSSSINGPLHSRPQRAAKLDCLKHLKEPSLIVKLRRDTTKDSTAVKIKFEREQGVLKTNELTISHESHVTSSKKTAKRVESTTGAISTDSTATFILETQNVQSVQGGGGNDLTFNVPAEKATQSQDSSMQSMETAHNTLQPHNDSLMTEYECPETPISTEKNMPLQAPVASKVITTSNSEKVTPAKTLPMPNTACKMATRTIEIFNPLVPSSVINKVAAYENLAASQAAITDTKKHTRFKAAKQNASKMVIALPDKLGAVQM